MKNLDTLSKFDECTTVDAADFEDADVAIVASYTYGDGELPDEIVDFYEDLADVICQIKSLVLFGSGDTSTIIFCKAVDEFEAQFALTGATKGADSIKVDLSADDEDIQKLEVLQKQFSEK